MNIGRITYSTHANHVDGTLPRCVGEAIRRDCTQFTRNRRGGGAIRRSAHLCYALRSEWRKRGWVAGNERSLCAGQDDIGC